MEFHEAKEILISAGALAVAFGIAAAGGITKLSVSLLAAAAVAVSLSFVLHELAHRFIARAYGAYAEYRMWAAGLVLALVFSLFGFVFAAPGAVVIHPKADLWGTAPVLTRKKTGIIALSGPLTNIALAGVFAALFVATHAAVFKLAVMVNIWLALFNLVPLPPLDGSKVLAWDAKIWAAAFALSAVLFLFSGF